MNKGRRFGGPTPTHYFRDGILSVPGYTFEKAVQWEDTGSLTLVAEGQSLKDTSNVLAKIAPAQSNGSMCLEREAHILVRMAEKQESYGTILRVIDLFTIPKTSGDCVVLLLSHPGLNLLGRYLPPSKVNDILLADISRVRPTSYHGDIYMMSMEEPDITEEMEAFDIMDLATFLEFAIQATHCLEVMHKCGFIHREVRANAFHVNTHTGSVRLVHFGNRSVSLENLGSPSSLVFRAYDEVEKLKVKEALCYLAPEQTGTIETTNEDHRTDLYSIGILFWTLLVGRGQMPFEGGPLELLHAIVQRRPMPVHEVRRDVPLVLASIVDKLLAKNPDARYQSAMGLKADLLECQRRLSAAVTSTTDQSAELIPCFDIAVQDRYSEFTMPIALFGREKELELIRNISRHTSTSFSRNLSASKGVITISSAGSQDTGTGTGEDNDNSDSADSRSDMSNAMDLATKVSTTATSPVSAVDPVASSISAQSSLANSEHFRRVALGTHVRSQRTRVVFVVGPPGVGKSSLILMNQTKWRTHGLWGQAKFQNADSGPFSTLLNCLSSVLRQLMVFHSDVHRFVSALQESLGPQLQNIALLYQGTPELKEILDLYEIRSAESPEPLATAELRARFQSLVEKVFTVISETRLFALYLDDLQEADQSTLDLVTSLMNARSRMLIFATLRSDKPELIERIKSLLASRARPTWIHLEPLPFFAISSFVAKTLHRPKEDCAALSRFVYSASSGNAFAARSLLTSLHRQGLIKFDWERNHWLFDMAAIENTMKVEAQQIADPNDLSFIRAHFKQFPEEARKYLIWASMFGTSFKITEVSLMMDWEDTSGSSGSEEENDDMLNVHRAVSSMRESTSASARSSMRGLHIAISEGWLVQRARDMCSFAHDRYWQAVQSETHQLLPETIAKMSFRIVLMMLHDAAVDVYRIAEYAKKCLGILHEHPKREELLEVLLDAGESAWARGAHELALESFTNARSLLKENVWADKPKRTLKLYSRLAALHTWKGNYENSDHFLNECLSKVDTPEARGELLRLRSRNHFVRNNFSAALEDTLHALHALGIQLEYAPSQRKADELFEVVKNEILAVGFDDILQIPRATDLRTELIISLLNDAGVNAYWSPSHTAFADIIGLTSIQVALRSGLTRGMSLGIFWSLGAAVERKGLYRFASDLAKLAIRIAERYGDSMEKCRANVLYASSISGYDSVHIRANLSRLEEALKYGSAAGDRIYTSFANVHIICTRLYIGDHLGELITAAEECASDVALWTPGADAVTLAMSVLNCIRALGGYTDPSSLESVFDTETFREKDFLASILASSGNVPMALNWYNSFKVVALFCLGFVQESAELGFSVYTTRDRHPNHRHVRFALFFHNLAMIACIRSNLVTSEKRTSYNKQIERNLEFIRKWLSPSAVNTSTWVAIVKAELASLNDDPNVFKLYDVAVKQADLYDWPLEGGWALYLQGSHFVRVGVEGLGGDLQRRGIARHSQWGAKGIVNYLSSLGMSQPRYTLRRPLFTTDAAVQTDNFVVGLNQLPQQNHMSDSPDNGELSMLTAANLASILTWSKDISSDINLSSALQKLTEIATENSGALNTCVVIAREAGDYTVATSMVPPEPCQVFENPKSVRLISDPLQKAIIRHTLNMKERVFLADASADSRFVTEAGQSAHKALICLPILGNRGQTFGALYVSSKYAFSQTTVIMLTLLCQQASISIANALLFRSVQNGTRENLKMISAQKSALEEARRSREDALNATKIKSNFLASMSHELRTPFSSFYGLLDLLGGTELTQGQNEIVQTAKQSCELLLKIIDSILDYSKLEASAVKLEFTGFPVENIIADCMELLLPMAALKLDLSFNIEPDVPPWVVSDYARIRQVLMNTIGNAVKFTTQGFVRVTCSLDTTSAPAPGEANLKFAVQDTGIGLSASDLDSLFVPFQQADNSTTRRFGGTGLGLSISRELVKLMGGAIGVHSELGVGSIFWFTIPTKIFTSDESTKSLGDIETLRAALNRASVRVLVCSQSDATLALLNTMLSGTSVALVSSLKDAKLYIQGIDQHSQSLDFVIVDDQSETNADEVAKMVRASVLPALSGTKVIHLYTPTTKNSTVSSTSLFNSNTPGIVKMTKPPRTLRLLQTLASLKNIATSVKSSAAHATLTKAAASSSNGSVRTLFGNILIAEDNPVARSLLIKQLERLQLSVTATENGKEALREWESHEPGYFSLALFDHHMPICDGVEAAKQLRVLENKRRAHVMLPIVALSADCQESTKQLCLSAGMNDFFTKPLKKDDLNKLITSFGTSAPSA